MSSPFADSASTYREQGLSVMPCGPGTKFPGRFTSADGWWKAHDWQKYCDRLPTAFEMEIWERWPDAGICLALGSASAPPGKILVAVDIDTDVPAEVVAIRSALPGSPVAKRGAKGETQFYLANPCVENTAFNDADKRRMLDLLAHGRQTVMPPSIHPDTRQPYRWVTPDALDHFPVADLPVLPDDVVERLAKALEPFGYRQPPKLGEAADPAELQGDKVHRALNDAALANLDAWVPALNLYKCKRVGAAYKAVADWRPSSSGRPDAKRGTNLAIRFDGIKDCGDNKGYTPLDLVMAACSCDLETAFRWLQERVAPTTPMLIVSNESPPRDTQANLSSTGVTQSPLPSCEPGEASIRRTSPPGNLAGLRVITSDGARVANLPSPTLSPMVDSPPTATIIPASACAPPGLLGALVQWMNDADDTPAPQLSLGAGVAFLGAIMGRRFAHPSKSARTNFYCVGVAPTGFGKQHAIDAIKELARRSNVDKFVGPGRYKSESAVRKTIEERPTVCSLMDELGGVMRDILSRKASEHRAGIRDILLELFSSARTTYTGSEGAAEKAVPVHNPNLCIYGTSTPQDLWGHVSSASASDGFLPRWLVFDGGTKKAKRRKATADVFDPPETLRRALHELLDVRPKGNLNGVTTVDPIKAEWGPGAEERFYTLCERLEEEVEAANEAGEASAAMVLSRFAEHVAKLSLVYAVGVLAPAPVITVAALKWAEIVVRHSTNTLIIALKGKVADNDFQAQFQEVWGLITEHGASGISEESLINRLNGKLESRRYEDILGQLRDGGRIWRALASGPRGGRPHKRIGVRVAEVEAG
jgi:hypothetical protein